jgi:hypothetical protein
MKMARTLASFWILGVSIGLAAAPAPKDRPPLGVYHPTKVGDKLVYEMDTGKGGLEMIDVVTEVEKKDGAVIVTISRDMGGKEMVSKLLVSATGLHRLSTGMRTYDPPICLLKVPAKVGETWESEFPSVKGGTGRKTIYTFRGEEEIEVPAGKFKALKVETEIDTGKGARATFWYVSGVGMVKWATRIGERERTYALKSFTVGK